jgi:hypothetical protein
VSNENLGERFIRWAQREPTVRVLTLIGSQAREGMQHGAADEFSDWDFHLITSNLRLFDRRDWMKAAEIGTPLAYVKRGGRLGTSLKVTAVFADGELDAVILPEGKLRLARRLFQHGFTRRIGALEHGLSHLSVVLRGGFRVLKGPRKWETFFSRVVAEVPPPRLSDDDVRIMAEGFVCDYVATCRKIDRGELLAAQRWLHHQLAEANYQLLHELRQREGKVSFPDARRLESIADEESLDAVRLNATLNGESLRAAADKCAATCHVLVNKLLAGTWQWPELPAGFAR